MDASFLTRKVGPLPLYAYGVAIGGGAAVIVAMRRRGIGTGGGSSRGKAAQGEGEAGSMFGGGSSGGGEAGLGGPASGAAPGGSFSFVPGAPANQFMPEQGAPSTPTPTTVTPIGPGLSGYYGTPESPIYRSQPLPDIGATPAASVTGISHITNPLGTALGLSQQPQNIYAPSALDLASEQPGGVTAVQAAVPGAMGGQSYTIYSAPGVAGTGPIVPVSRRVAGERYDPQGRVIM